MAWLDQRPNQPDGSSGRSGFFSRLPTGRMGEPAEMANVALFLAGDEASYVNAATLVVDGGTCSVSASPRY